MSDSNKELTEGQIKLLEKQPFQGIHCGPAPKVDIFKDVLEFRKLYGLKASRFPINPSSYDRARSVDLIREEASELYNATSIEDNLDACIDLLYVVVQKFYDLGLSDYWEEGWRRVHKANMKKLWTSEDLEAKHIMDGVDDYEVKLVVETEELGSLYVVKRYGKIQKPASFVAPEFKDLFEL